MNETLQEFYFLEINPRLQVEHTVTECISGIDLVQTQLFIAQGAPLEKLDLPNLRGSGPPPSKYSIQLRLCAEDPESNFGLSIGTVTQMAIPSGLGVRVDTHVSVTKSTRVGPDYDNLLAKIIVTAGNWESVVRKACRVLADVVATGIKTNLDLLCGIVNHDDFLLCNIDTLWLEKNKSSLMSTDNVLSRNATRNSRSLRTTPLESSQSPLAKLASSSSNLLFRKGDSWSLTLEPIRSPKSHEKSGETNAVIESHLMVTRILRNEFPSSLTAEIEYSQSVPSSLIGTIGKSAVSTTAYRIQVAETSASASALTTKYRRGDQSNKNHVVFPLSGKLIEVLVAPGDAVVPNQVVAFVKQMKMELEIRSHRAGVVKWVFDLSDDNESYPSQGVDVAEGSLLLEFEDVEAQGQGEKAVIPQSVTDFKGKL